MRRALTLGYRIEGELMIYASYTPYFIAIYGSSWLVAAMR